MKKLVTMAHDLELHEHYADHQAGRDCGSDPTECLIKTRIWQNIFICEMMIGGPQGMSKSERNSFTTSPLTASRPYRYGHRP